MTKVEKSADGHVLRAHGLDGHSLNAWTAFNGNITIEVQGQYIHMKPNDARRLARFLLFGKGAKK